MSRSCVVTLLLSMVVVTVQARATDPDRDFSGKWVLDPAASNTQSLGADENSLTITQGEAGLTCVAGPGQWSYAFDGSETRKQAGDETRTAVARWEGNVLLIHTQVKGASEYSVIDRWSLSSDRNTLTIARHVTRGTEDVEGSLVYRYQNTTAAATEPQSGGLSRRPEPGSASDITIPTGTHVLLALIGEISTKHAKDGDHVYLTTATPVAAEGRIIIPRGSDVFGTITRTKRAGKLGGKGELYIRFDSLILPNGVTRDFKSRPSGEEGKMDANGKSVDPHLVLLAAGTGAQIGGATKGVSGAAAGAAIGSIAAVMLTRNQDVILRAGTHVEMIFDRDIIFHADELPY
ncbi:MAG TPA: hypothetical protein VKU19_10840 [Bryobacteraceae bacterium]|nr:hypothetical protein [Bryobacteraceae bacterium]